MLDDVGARNIELIMAHEVAVQQYVQIKCARGEPFTSGQAAVPVLDGVEFPNQHRDRVDGCEPTDEIVKRIAVKTEGGALINRG